MSRRLIDWGSTYWEVTVKVWHDDTYVTRVWSDTLGGAVGKLRAMYPLALDITAKEICSL